MITEFELDAVDVCYSILNHETILTLSGGRAWKDLLIALGCFRLSID